MSEGGAGGNVRATEVTADRPEHAQVLDHLECFKVKDPGNYSAFVDLQSTEYGTQTDCKVKVKAKFYCVPSTKTVADTTAPEEDIDGPPHFGPQVCYTIQSCPDDGPTGHEVTDQFGHRTLQNVKRKLVCAPRAGALPGVMSASGRPERLLARALRTETSNRVPAHAGASIPSGPDRIDAER